MRQVGWQAIARPNAFGFCKVAGRAGVSRPNFSSGTVFLTGDLYRSAVFNEAICFVFLNGALP